MATRTWDGGAATDFWNLADNWDLNTLPSSGDDIEIAGGFGTTIFNGSNPLAGLTVASLDSGSNLNVSGGFLSITGTASVGAELSITGGNLTLNGTSSVNNFTQSSGSLSGTGVLTITGASTITFGDHRGTGTTILQGPSTISSSGFRLDGGRTLRNENTVTWSGGTILFNNNVNGTQINGSGTLNNLAGATFIASGDAAASIAVSNFGGTDTGADALFTNAGTFRKSSSTATDTTTVAVTFDNTGTVDVQTGILSLTNGGTHSGNFTGTAGTIGFGGGTHLLNAGSSITTQNVQFSGSGTTTVNGTYNVAGTTGISNGTAAINGTLPSLGSALNISGGVLNINASNASIGSLTQSSGALAGTGTVTVTGNAAITFGDHRGTGTTILQGPSTISSSGFRLDGGRTLRNENTVTWSGGTILFNNNVNGTQINGSGTLNNLAGATFIASGDAAASIAVSNFGGTDTGADALFTNAGTFRKSSSTATDTTTVAVTFDNTGTVDVQTGILSLTNGGTHSGNFTGTAGTIGFGGGTHLLNAGSTITTQNVQFSGSGTTTINGTYNVAGTTGISNGTATINGTLPSLGSALNISGGVLNINASNASIGSLTQSGGALAGTGTVTVTGNAAITFGDHRGTGTTILQGPSTISSSGFRLDGGRTLRNEDTLTWSGGTILFNNNVNGTQISGSGTLNNLAGATFIASGDAAGTIDVSNFGGTDTGADALIANAGTFRKSGSSANDITTVDVTFNNTGAVDLQTGILNFTNGGTHSGNFNVAANTVLGFGGGTHDLNAGTITSPGTVRLSGSATVNVNTAYAIAGTTEIQSASLNLSGNNASSGALIQSNGTVSGTGNFTVTGTSAITFGDHRGTGTTTLQGPTTIEGTGFRLDGGRTLRNEDTLTWSGGTILFNNNVNGTQISGSGTLNNLAGATFIASGDAAGTIDVSNFGGTDTGADALIANAGTFRKSGSSANDITTVDVTFNNTGAVDLQTGILNFTNGGTHSGNFNVAANTVLGFGGGTHDLNAGTITSPGTVRLSGSATVNVNTAYAIAGTTEIQSASLNLSGNNASSGALIQSNGTVSGTGNFTVTGTSAITFGDHRGTGTTTLQGPTTIEGTGFRLDGGRTLRNEDTLTWSGGTILFNNNVNGTQISGSGTLNNLAGATFIASGDAAGTIDVSNFGGTDTGADALIANAGTFRKSGSSANDITTVDVTFNNTGAVDLQTGIVNFTDYNQAAGETRLNGGTLLSFNDIDITGGIISGQGTIDINNSGVDALNLDSASIAPGIGGDDYKSLTLEGNLQSSGDSFVDIEIGSLALFDILDISNAANFAAGDTINILRSAGYTPNLGDSFTILTFGSAPADLANRLQFTNLAISPTLSFQPIFNTNDITLQVVQTAAPAGITVSPTSGLVTTEWGSTAQFSVVLNTQPTGDVTIGISSSDTSEGTASTSSLTFTAANWNVAQTVTVTGVDDALVDGDVAYSIVTAAAVSGDTNYSGLDVDDVSLTNTDNDADIEYGDCVAASIDFLGEKDAYLFDGSAGDRIFARMSEADGAPTDFLPELTLYAPDGTEVASDFGPSNAFLEAVELAQSGTYSLVANDLGGDATGDYTICLQSLLNPGNPVELDYGDSVPASIDPGCPCEFDVYTFTGSAGDRIFARMSEADGAPTDFLPELTLYAPDGTEVASDFGPSNAFLEAVELAQSGTYRLIATDNEGDATGDYTICLQSLLNPGNPVELDYGDSVTASIDPACEFDVYTFTGSAGDRIFARMSEADGAPTDFLPELTLYAPDGTEVASDFGPSNAFLEAVELAQSGTYRLIATDNEGDATGDYTICLQSLLNPGNPVELDYGDSVTASIDPACEFDVYTFTGSAGDRIFARMSEADGAPTDFLPELTLYAPDGTEVASDFGPSNAFLEAVELAQSGTYRLIATDNEGDATGDYTISLNAVGITVTPTSGLVTTENGGTASFSVVLNSQPTDPVTIDISSSDTSEGTLSTGSLTFSATDWNIAQSVTVTGVDDAIVDGNIAYAVITAAAVSSDAAYNGLDADDVSLINNDNDVITLYGPTPYLSFSDSPFSTLSLAQFYLEDFEDGLLNTPGVEITNNTPGGLPLGVVGPGFFGDSVDADDGVIDGLGRNGRSFASLSNESTEDFGFTISFSDNALGGFPTYAGLVWTDGSQTAPTLFEAFDANGNSLGVVGPVKIGDNSFAGTTAEDSFFGAHYSGGISKLIIRDPGGVNTLEIDHLQYGLDVPAISRISVNPTSGLVTTENGGTASFSVVLNSQPTANCHHRHQQFRHHRRHPLHLLPHLHRRRLERRPERHRHRGR